VRRERHGQRGFQLGSLNPLPGPPLPGLPGGGRNPLTLSSAQGEGAIQLQLAFSQGEGAIHLQLSFAQGWREIHGQISSSQGEGEIRLRRVGLERRREAARHVRDDALHLGAIRRP
jgi:hypothetical protein